MSETKRKKKVGDPVLVTIDGSQVEGAFVRLVGIQKTGNDGKKHRSSVRVDIQGEQRNYPYEDVHFLPVVDQPLLTPAEPQHLPLPADFVDMSRVRFLMPDGSILPASEAIPFDTDNLPTAMMEYLDNPEEAAAAMAEHGVKGYEWNPDTKYWEKEISDEEREKINANLRAGLEKAQRIMLFGEPSAAEQPVEHVWVNELQLAYVMVDSDGVIFTYEVEEGVESLEDLQDLMQIKGWRLGQDAVADEPRIKVYTIEDKNGTKLATYVPGTDHLHVHEDTGNGAVRMSSEEMQARFDKIAGEVVVPVMDISRLGLGSAIHVSKDGIREVDPLRIIMAADQPPLNAMPSEVTTESIMEFLNDITSQPAEGPKFIFINGETVDVTDFTEEQFLTLLLGSQPAPKARAAADAKVGDWIWYLRQGEKHYALIDKVRPDSIVFGNGYSLPMSHFGINWGFANPYKVAGEEVAAGPSVDAPNELDAAEEPKTPVASEMLALRWNSEILGEERMPYRIWGRQHINGDRHYVVQTPGGSIDFRPGPTTVLKATMPKPESLLRWAINAFAKDGDYDAYMTERTGYGSVVHGVLPDALMGVTKDFDDRQWWLEYLKVACARNGCRGMESKWLLLVQKSLMSIRQWAADYNVVFLMVEKALYAPVLGVAGQIDILCEMDSHIQNVKSTVKAKREAPTRILALVDIKTGKDSDQYPAQLAMYTQMLIEGFPRIKEIIAARYPHQIVDDGFRIYNIPCFLLFPESGWRKAPKAARMLDRTEKAAEYAATQMHHHIALFQYQRRQPGTRTVLKGPSGFDFTNDNSVGFKTLADLWMDKINAGELDPIEDITEEEDGEA